MRLAAAAEQAAARGAAGGEGPARPTLRDSETPTAMVGGRLAHVYI